jgi:hypothetical protein
MIAVTRTSYLTGPGEEEWSLAQVRKNGRRNYLNIHAICRCGTLCKETDIIVQPTVLQRI